MIVMNHARSWANPGCGGNGLIPHVDGLDLAHVQISAGQHTANRTDRIEHANTARDDLGQHWLKNEVVLFIDQQDLKVLTPAQRLFQMDRSVNTSEAATQDDNTLTPLFVHDFLLPSFLNSASN